MTNSKVTKRPKITSMQFSSKITLVVHDSAKDSYELFCDIYTKLNLDVITNFSDKIVNIIKLDDIYYFFDDYGYFINLQDGDVIYTRLADEHEENIKQAGRNAVFNFIKTIHPLKPDIIRAFIKALPDDIVIEDIGHIQGKLKIADVLRHLKEPRYRFDYQDKKLSALHYHRSMPTFEDLIMEVINEDVQIIEDA